MIGLMGARLNEERQEQNERELRIGLDGGEAGNGSQRPPADEGDSKRYVEVAGHWSERRQAASRSGTP